MSLGSWTSASTDYKHNLQAPTTPPQPQDRHQPTPPLMCSRPPFPLDLDPTQRRIPTGHGAIRPCHAAIFSGTIYAIYAIYIRLLSATSGAHQAIHHPPPRQEGVIADIFTTTKPVSSSQKNGPRQATCTTSFSTKGNRGVLFWSAGQSDSGQD